MWPAFVLPKENELFSSWMARLAYSHGQHIELFKEIWPQWGFKDIDLYAGNYVAETLTAYTTVNFVSIRNASFGIYGDQYLKWLLPIEDINRAKNRYGLMICPNCLKNDGDDPYHRKLWRMGFAFMCLECQCYLIDRCPSCHAPLSVFNQKIMARSVDMVLPLNLCFSCRFDLARATIVYPKSNLIDFQAKINLTVKGDSITSHSPFNEKSLYSLCYEFGERRKANDELAAKVARELNMPLIRSNWKDTKGFTNLDLERRKYYLIISEWLLDEPSAKVDFIAKHYKIYVTNEVLKVCRYNS